MKAIRHGAIIDFEFLTGDGVIDTLEGLTSYRNGDVIIREENGEEFFMKRNVFEKKYSILDQKEVA
jgi:hypothetical protein